jgi:hypothetical protein
MRSEKDAWGTADRPPASENERWIFSFSAIGHALRCWYLRTLLDHYLASAESEAYAARQHVQTVEYFREMVRAIQEELAEAEG